MPERERVVVFHLYYMTNKVNKKTIKPTDRPTNPGKAAAAEIYNTSCKERKKKWNVLIVVVVVEWMRIVSMWWRYENERTGDC